MVRTSVPSLCACLSLAVSPEAEWSEVGARHPRDVPTCPDLIPGWGGGINIGCGKGVMVAVDFGEIDHLSSQETLFNHNRPAGSLCSGKGSVRAALRERRKMFSFASNNETTQGLISPKAFWFPLLSELLWLDWNCENQNEDPHPLTHSLGRTSVQLGS